MEQQLKELEVKPNKMAFQVALAFAIYTLALIYLFKVLGIDTQEENVSVSTRVISSICSYVPFILGILYVQNKHKEELGGYMTYGRGFSAGFRVSSYAGFFIGLLMILYYKVLDPEALNQLMEISIEKAGEDEKAIRAIKSTIPYMPFLVGFTGAITYTLLGLVISLVGAAFVKKERPLDS